MRFGIYTSVTPSPYTGVGRQLYGLLEGLVETAHGHDFLLFCHPAQALPAAPHFRRVHLPAAVSSRLPNHLYQAFLLRRLAERHDVSLMHVPNTMPLLFPFRPTVVTLFDLAEFVLREPVYERGRLQYRRLANRLAARRSNYIITTSLSTKKDIVRYCGVAGEKVTVIYPGVDHDHFRPLTLDATRQARLAEAYGLPERFLLYVGKIQPRKNLVRVLHAFHEVRKAHDDLYLVLAGVRGWMEGGVDAAVEELDLAHFIRAIGLVAEDDLPALYNLAEAAVFPSLYEGFGFPVVEAMACGTPLVTSSTSSLGEVAGPAAVTVEPTDVQAMAEAILALVGDRALRAALREKGLARAGEFTWERCARETVALFEKVAA
jgi:glycosyltransferase involved in cell wall biosynthesis